MLYTNARTWGIQPSEFWEMTFSEWFTEYWTHSPPPGRFAGKLTENDVDELCALLEQYDAA